MSDVELPRRWWEVVLDAVAIVGVLAVLAVPAAAVLSVGSEPAPADATGVLPPLRHAPAGRSLRAVPVFAPGGDAAAELAAGTRLTREPAMTAAVDRQFRSVFGPAGAPALQALVADFRPGYALTSERVARTGAVIYPYRTGAVDRILDTTLGAGAVPAAKVAAVNDLAGLLVLTAVRFPRYQNAAMVAYALYDRARRTDACDPQLNVAFLASTDPFARAGDVASEFQRAARDCPGDPTPRWLLGEFQSLRGGPASTTFVQLEKAFPGSPLGWSGEADALVRLGYRSDVARPFTARAAFRRALLLYQRAELLDHDPGLAAGEARAAAGLGDYSRAVRAQRRALAGDRAPPFQVRLADYLEREHRFAEAAGVDARLLEARTPVAPTAGLIANGTDSGDTVAGEDALGPISIGTGHLLPVQFYLGNPPLPFTGGLDDISFIPRFRSVAGVTGDLSGCPEASLARDLVLAGRPADGLTALATTAADRGPGVGSSSSCDPSGGMLRAVALLEHGDPRAAAAAAAAYVSPNIERDANPNLALTLDADQNMWRYAGNLQKAAEVVKHWTEREPSDPLAPDRAGEIAYLQGNFESAATDFAAAAKRARGEPVATEELKEGTAIGKAGQPTAALALLHTADRIASADVRVTNHDHGTGMYANTGSGSYLAPQAVLDSYNARLQSGDAEMRRHEFAAAEEQFSTARSREAQLPPLGYVPGVFASPGEELFRPEVLENNEALVLLELGRAEDARRAIDRALRFDPANPIFLANKGAVEQKLGHIDAAVAGYRAALASDPTSFQAANNLGVLLAGEKHLDAAAGAFREALATNRNDTTAEFNLGLVLDRMGPSHILEAQGLLAAAGRRDPELRDHDHTFIVDNDTFFSTLDLSKPLPPTWHFASSTKNAPISIGGIVLLLLLYKLVKTVVESRVSDEAAERALETSRRRVSARVVEYGASAPGALALAAVVAVFVYPLARSSGTTRGDLLLLGGGIAVMTLAFMRLRSAIARRSGVTTQHYPWIPAVFVGGAAALVGIGFAPMPATKGSGAVPSGARWLGTGLLGAFTILLLVAGRFSGVPFATELGAICLVMTSSALVPVAPYDGAFIKERHVVLLLVIALATIDGLIATRVL